MRNKRFNDYQKNLIITEKDEGNRYVDIKRRELKEKKHWTLN